MLDSCENNPKPILRLRDLGDEMKNPTPWLIKTCFCFYNLDTLNQPWNVIYIQYWGQHLDLEKWLFILAGMMLLSTKKLGNLSSSGQWLASYRDITRVAVNMALSINYHYILERWEPSIMFHNPPLHHTSKVLKVFLWNTSIDSAESLTIWNITMPTLHSYLDIIIVTQIMICLRIF